MKETHRIEGIVIRVFESGDSDLVLHIITPDIGKISAIAKSAKKQKKNFGARYDVFDQGIFELTDPDHGLATIRSFSSKGALLSLRSDLDKLSLASVIAEGVDMLLKEGPEYNAAVFESIELGLRALDEEKALNDLLKSTFYALSYILNAVGISQTLQDEKPSPRKLMELIARIENFSERRMKTRPALEEILKHFRVKKR